MESEDHNNSYTHILKTTGLFGGVQGISILVSVLRTKLVALLLGPDGMGLTALFNSTIKFVSDSTGFGIQMSGVREVSEAFESGDKARLERNIAMIRLWSLFAALLGMLVCLVLSPLLNKWTFTWGDHTLHFVLLSPVVAMMAVTAGELAVLKGIRQLKALAVISLYNILLSLFLTVPLYYFFGEAAIVPSLIIVALEQMLVTIFFSWRHAPFKLSWNRDIFNAGTGMIRLGIAFVLAGILGSGADLLVRSYLNNVADLSTVGIFNAGYMMIMVYGGMVFSAMETDYFPRLSAVGNPGESLNDTVNKQIEVTLLIISPLLAAFILSLPVLVPLLLSGKFVAAIPMMQVGILALYLRAVKLPVAYIPLSRGDSKSYLLMEAIFDVVMVVVIIIGYRNGGLRGIGWAILAVSLFDFVMLMCYHGWRYGYRISGSVVKYMAVQLPLGLLTFFCTYFDNKIAYWLCGLTLVFLSLMASLRILQSKTKLWSALKRKVLGKFGKAVEEDEDGC